MHTRSAAWLFAFGWLVLFLAACSAPPASALRLGTTLWTYQGASSVFTAAWSPGGNSLALGEADGTVQVRDAVAGTLTFSLDGHTAAVWALAWSPDGKRIASASWDGTVRVWDTVTGHLLLIYRGHTGEVLAVAWSPDGTHLASAGSDDTVQVWKATTGEPLLTYRG